jgi:hypothetical protein
VVGREASVNEETDPSAFEKIILTSPFAIVTVPLPLSVRVTFAAYRTLAKNKRNNRRFFISFLKGSH